MTEFAPLKLRASRFDTYQAIDAVLVDYQVMDWRRIAPGSVRYAEVEITKRGTVFSIAIRQTYDFSTDAWDDEVVAVMQPYNKGTGRPATRSLRAALALDRDNLPEWLTATQRQFIESRPVPDTRLQFAEVAR